jgi:hypothetical protein
MGRFPGNTMALTDEFVKRVCAPPPRGPSTCSYLLAGAGGWVCAKTEYRLTQAINERRTAGTIRAKGDNCTGPPLFIRMTPART